MGTKSRETIYGASVRAAAERAREARKQSDRLACEAWNKRMLASRDRRSRRRLWARLLMPGTATSKSAALAAPPTKPWQLDVIRRPKTTAIHELERRMRCQDCSRVRGCAYKRSHLVALRRTKCVFQPIVITDSRRS